MKFLVFAVVLVLALASAYGSVIGVPALGHGAIVAAAAPGVVVPGVVGVHGHGGHLGLWG